MLIFYVSFQIIFELLKVIFLLKLKLSQKLSFIHTLIKNSGFGLYKKNSRYDFMPTVFPVIVAAVPINLFVKLSPEIEIIPHISRNSNRRITEVTIIRLLVKN